MRANESPLNIDLDLTNVTTTIPLIVDGWSGRVRLKNISQTERDGNTGLKWEFILGESAPTVEGGQVNPGFPLFINIDLSRDFLQQKMARYIDGLLGTGDVGNKQGKPPRPRINAETVSELLGREAVAKITVVKSKQSDYVGNDIQTLTFIGDGQ